MNRMPYTSVLGCFILLLTAACQKNTITTPTVPTGDNSEVSLDWAGTYSGVVPCADCEGITTTLSLHDDKTYRLSTRYLGKSTEPFEREGTFTWYDNGSKVKLEGIRDGADRYLVGENILFQLDMEGNRITGNLAENYQLRKIEQVSENPLAGKKWILKEMMGKELPGEVGAIFLEFDEDGTRVSGFGGCNNFFGECEVKAGNRINLDKMGRTQKFCQGNSEVEDALFKAFENIDNFSLGEDGMLSLNRARMAPLLRFKLVDS
jgi:copper homeostasis protein (lipoprotein)